MKIPPKQPQPWWNEIGLGPFLEKRLHLTPERIDDTVESSRELGKAVAMSWNHLDETVNKVLHHPLWGDHLKPGAEHAVNTSVLAGVQTLGYSLAGIQGVAGAAKLIQGVRERKGAGILDGFLDLTAGAAIASTLVGVGPMALVLGPVAAGLGVARGAVRAVRAYQAADPGKEVQAFLDATRSATLLSTVAGYSLPAAGIAAAYLGPVAVAVQACRGHVVLRTGLETHDKSKQISGLADLGMAVGLGMTFCGLGLPGIAVTVATASVNLLYKVLPVFQRGCDKVLDRVEKPLGKFVGTIERLVSPTFNAIRRWIDAHSPWQHGEDKPPPPPGPEEKK